MGCLSYDSFKDFSQEVCYNKEKLIKGFVYFVVIALTLNRDSVCLSHFLDLSGTVFAYCTYYVFTMKQTLFCNCYIVISKGFLGIKIKSHWTLNLLYHPYYYGVQDCNKHINNSSKWSIWIRIQKLNYARGNVLLIRL